MSAVMRKPKGAQFAFTVTGYSTQPVKRQRYDSPEQERLAARVLRKHSKALRELAK